MLTRTEIILYWITPALLGALLGLIVYADIDPQVSTPLSPVLFTLAGMIGASLVAYACFRFLLGDSLAGTER